MKKAFSKKGIFSFVLMAIFLFIGDQFLKYWTYHHFPNAQYASPFYPYGGIGVFQNILGIDFCLNRVMNHGGAWGIFGTFPVLLIIVRLAILGGILFYTLFFNKMQARIVPLMLILTGAVGNVVDFFTYGAVVDMFHFILWGYSFPVFNIADILIFVGVATLLIQSFLRNNYASISQQSS